MYRRFSVSEREVVDLLSRTPEQSGSARVVSAVRRGLIRRALSGLLDPSGSISVERMSDEWFPEIGADVFISHAHDRLDIARALGDWLKTKLGLKSFIDSDAWGYAPTLQRKIDDAYSRASSSTFDYEKSNLAASHVHMVLISAITKMINRCEVIFFIEAPGKLAISDISGAKALTYSPWIYHEMLVSRLIETTAPRREGRSGSLYEARRKKLAKAMPAFLYKEDSGDIDQLTRGILSRWSTEWRQDQSRLDPNFSHALDLLYQLVP